MPDPAAADGTATGSGSTALLRFYRPPLVGALALLAVFLAVPLTHSLSMVARSLASQVGPLLAYLPIGIAGLGLLVHGVRRNEEITGTLCGFASGLLLWTGWAAYAFRANELSLGLPMQSLGEGTRWPNNLLYIEGSFGICVVTLLYFVLNRDTRCNAFLWIQRVLRLDLGRPESGQGRNYCRVTFVETVYVTWFCYGASLFMADPRFVGYGTPLHYALVAALIAWGLYLTGRLLRFTRIMAAIRYAIATKAILWIPFGEALPKYGLYEEFWLQPWEHPGTVLGGLALFLALFVVTAVLPQRRTAG